MDGRTHGVERALRRVRDNRRGLTGVVAVGVTAALVASCGQLVDQSGSQATTTGSRPRETLIAAERPRAAAAPPKRPNVLVIETDDMRADDLRFMPNVRRLIKQRGLSFENSFAPDPLCAPSRASFLSGQYAHNHHVYTHQEPYGFAAFEDQQSIATVMHGAGYQTGLVGKYLNGYGEQYLRSDKSSLRYIPPGWDQWYAGSDHLWDFDSPNYAGGTYSYNKLVQNINGTIHSFPKQYSTDVVAEQARGVIDGFEKKSRAPWFVWWTPTAPHHGLPRESDDPAPTRRRDGQFSEWDTPGRPNWVKGRFDSQITHGAGAPTSGSAEEDTSDKPYYLRKQPELTQAEKDAETNVTRQRAESLFALDVQIRQTFRHLRKLHQLRNTVIVFTSDNGYYLGEHLRRTGKVNLHEPSLRVPLLVVGPGVPHGRRYDPVTTVDLAPTFAAYAGTAMPGADGSSMLPTISGDQGWDRAVVTEGMMGFGRYGEKFALGRSPLDTRGLRLGRWKLTRYSTGEAELYDLKADPLELNNLARVTAYAGTLRQLERLYDRYHDCRGDQCRVALPATWRLSVAQSRRLTQHQLRATQLYFDN